MNVRHRFDLLLSTGTMKVFQYFLSASDSIIFEDSCAHRAVSNSTQSLAGSFFFPPSLHFSASSLLSLLNRPLVQSHYRHFCQTLHKMQFQMPVINNSLFLFPPPSLLFSFQTMVGVDRQCPAVISAPPSSLGSTSTNICCVQSGFGHGSEGVDSEVKPISMQIVMTSCVLLSWWSSQKASGKEVWALNGSMLLTNCCPARFPPAVPQRTRTGMCVPPQCTHEQAEWNSSQ